MPARRPAAFVFIQGGCPACHDFMPKFKQASRGFPYKVGVYDIGKGGHGAEFANRMRIRATPTTVVLDSGGHLHRREGTMPVADISALLGRAR